MATSQKIAERVFTYQDQTNFASLTGDYNPIHMDAVAARRSIVGDMVVHGMHTVLWALEALCRHTPHQGQLAKIDVRFPKPTYLNEKAELYLSCLKDGSQRLTVQVGEKKTGKIHVWWSALPHADQETTQQDLNVLDAPQDPANSQMAAQKGTVPYAAPSERFAESFPHAAQDIGAGVLRDIAATSTLVGMQCPGLRSLYSRLELEWSQTGSAEALEYSVASVDTRYGLLTIAIRGHGLAGHIEAFHLPPSARQLTIAEVAERIPANQFAGQTALIIGGSRGLGELTAKMITAGGGHAIITYAVGRKDADAVKAEIRAFGGKIDVMQYDITRPATEQLTALDGLPTPTHLYYYATTQIFRPRAQAFEAERLGRFMAFYVDGFLSLCQALHNLKIPDLACFYPSSIAVTERPSGLTEYAMAKAAGEILASDLNTIFPGYHATWLRLPRLMTDQTTVVTPQKLPQAIDILLPKFEEMQNN